MKEESSIDSEVDHTTPYVQKEKVENNRRGGLLNFAMRRRERRHSRRGGKFCFRKVGHALARKHCERRRRFGACLPLALLKTKESAIICFCRSSKPIKDQLVGLGLIEDEIVTVKRSCGYGDLIIEVKSTDVAISHVVAREIFVEPLACRNP